MKLWEGDSENLWADICSDRAGTVMLESAGLRLSIRVHRTKVGKTMLAHLHVRETGGITWSDAEDRDYPPAQAARRIVDFMHGWALAVRLESASSDPCIFEVHECTAGLRADGTGYDPRTDHTGTCGFWRVHGPMNARYAHGWTGSRHACINVHTDQGPRPYAEVIHGRETRRSAGFRAALDDRAGEQA